MAIWSAEIKELEKLYESLKGQLPDLEKELERLIKADDENMILLYSRRCLEVIITDLCECELKRPRKTEPLKGIIDKLHKEEKVPSHIITSMHGLNELSTYGAHPKDFDPEQVKPVLVNLDIIIKWYLKYKQIVTIGRTEVEEEKVQLRKEPLEEVKIVERTEVQEKTAKAGKSRLISIVALAAILIIAAVLVYPIIFKRNTLEKLRSSGERISIAVMPFQNMTNDTLWDIWQRGIQDNLITALSNSQDLKVRNKESVNRLLQKESPSNYASVMPSIGGLISKQLDADVFVSGSINKVGQITRLNAQLTDSQTDDVFKSFQIDGPSDEIFHSVDSLSSMVMDFLIISKLVNELPSYKRYLPATTSPEAYRCYLQGESARSKKDYATAKKMFAQALSIDTNYAHMDLMLSVVCVNQGAYIEARKWSDKAYSKVDRMSNELKILTNRNHAFFYETPVEEIKYLRLYLEIDDKFPGTYYDIGLKYSNIFEYDKAIPEFVKALDIYHKLRMKPWWIYNYTELGYAYHNTKQYKKEKKIYDEAEKDFPNESTLTWRQAILYLTIGDTMQANKYLKKYNTIYKENSWPEAALARNLGWAYTQAGMQDEAEESFRRAVSLEPKNGFWYYYLGLHLIDKDRNIDEGLQMIDKALELLPNYEWLFLDYKGWGIYKQGKYQDALQVLEKSWKLQPYYNHEKFLHLQEVRKAIANQKNN
jgi:tetratricopeptide (TPR) repeat protein